MLTNFNLIHQLIEKAKLHPTMRENSIPVDVRGLVEKTRNLLTKNKQLRDVEDSAELRSIRTELLDIRAKLVSKQKLSSRLTIQRKLDKLERRMSNTTK